MVGVVRASLVDETDTLISWDDLQLTWSSDGIPSLLVCVASRSVFRRIASNSLSADERARCERLRAEQDRERFLAAHGLKRRALGSLLGRDASLLRFVSDKNGKPQLDPPALHFNLSHSGAWVALAVSAEAAVGIDVERSDRSRLERLRARIEHPDEYLEPGVESEQAGLLARWTLKEAITKGTGRGLRQAFRELRLEAHGQGAYSSELDGERWYAGHRILEDGAHLAFACRQPWKRLRIIRVCDEGVQPR